MSSISLGRLASRQCRLNRLFSTTFETNNIETKTSTASGALTIPQSTNSPLVTITPKEAAIQPQVHLVSGAPPSYVTSRRVHVYQPAASAMQSGSSGFIGPRESSRPWRITFDKQTRWENRLMGWTSSGDAVQSLEMNFVSRDAAVRFAQRQGWNVVAAPEGNTDELQGIQPQPRPPRTYADNFKFEKGEIRFVRTK